MTRPQVTLKIATSMDGRIALSNGESQWITGSKSRARVHEMRAAHDVVLVGVGTVIADDPLLSARTVPLPERQPARMVADSGLRTPKLSRLVQSGGLGRVILATALGETQLSEARADYASDTNHADVDIWPVGDETGRVSPQRLLDRCAVEGLTKIFLEGGGQLAASFIKAGLVDRIEWFRAPLLIGGDGLPAVAALGLTQMEAAPRWRTAATARIGDDTLETYVRA